MLAAIVALAVGVACVELAMAREAHKTPMVIVLKDGETLEGVIEWYDKASLKVNREEGPNLLVYKANIKYMYKREGA